MEEIKKIYNLYSEQEKMVILTIQHKLSGGEFSGDAKNVTEVICVVDGSLKITFSDKTEVFLKDGDLFIISRGRKYTVTFDTQTEFFMLKFNFSDWINDGYRIFEKGDITKFLTFAENTEEKINSVHINAAKIQETLFLIENQFENRDTCSDLVIKAYVTLIFSLIIQYYFGDHGIKGIDKAVHYQDIEKTLLYIQEHLSEKISLEKLSQIAAMGKTNYSVTFKQITGMTVWEYIQNARVELASSYLLENKTDFSITEVAFRCGFNTLAHFNKTFKKLKGQTPSEFKKNPDNPCF